MGSQDRDILSRRNFLRLAGLAAAGLATSRCGPEFTRPEESDFSPYTLKFPDIPMTLYFPDQSEFFRDAFYGIDSCWVGRGKR